MEDQVPGSYDEYRLEFLRSTHLQAFMAWSGGVLVTYLVECLIHSLHRPLPLLKLMVSRLVILALLYWVYRRRRDALGSHQLKWVVLNFLGFAVYCGWLGATVDFILGLPIYASIGFVLAAACAHYPIRLPLAVILPATVGAVFVLSYQIFLPALLVPGLLVCSLVVVLSPLVATFGSVRLDKTLRDAYASNRRLVDEVGQTRRTKARLSVTLENISDAVIAVDCRNRVELFNVVATELLGLEPDELLGKKLQDVLRLVDADGAPLELETDHSWCSPGDTQLTTANGKPLYIRVASSPLINHEGERTGSVLILQDLTELRRWSDERLRHSRLESLGVLAGGLAHDFNNLLTAIQGNISLAELEVEQANPARESLVEADFAVQKARELASRLLTFSKGGDPLKKLLPLAPLVREVVEFHVRGTKTKAVLDLQEQLYAELDPTQVNQAIQNLVINAVEAMPEGGRLKVALQEAEGMLRLTFSDQGPGVSEKLRQKIFDPYFSTKEAGSGLGLATAFSVARRHGGSLTLEEAPEEGDIFVLSLPAAQPPEPQSAEGRTKRAVLRALVMDDEENVRKVACRMLERLGFETESAAEGGVALDLYRQQSETGEPFSVVLIDLTVPQGMGGQDLIARLLEYDSEVTAVVASGYSDDPVMSQSSEYGFAAALAKPFGFQQLREVLERLDLLSAGTSGQSQA